MTLENVHMQSRLIFYSNNILTVLPSRCHYQSSNFGGFILFILFVMREESRYFENNFCGYLLLKMAHLKKLADQQNL